MEALLQNPAYDHVSLESEEDQRQRQLEEDQSEDPNSCILCGDSSSYNYHKPRNGKNTPHWSVWRAECGVSICKLVSFSGSDARALMIKGPYCLQCSCLVWDVHFTMKQLSTLEQRLRSLKASVEDKIRGLGNQGGMPRAGRRNSAVSEMLENRGMSHRRDAKFWNIGDQRQETELNEQYIPPIVQIKEEQMDFGAGFGWSQDIGSESFAPPANPLPVKRKRGRPRKDARNETPYAADPDWGQESQDIELEDVPEFSPSLDPESESDDDEEWTQATKRKRGRPRKDEAFKGDANSKDGQLPRRKRGRPRKKPPGGTNAEDPDYPAPSELSESLTGRRKKKKGPKPCPVCSAECRTRIALNRHVQKEHPDYMFECAACPRKYKRLELLDSHIHSVHGTLSPFHCSICRQGLDTQDELTQHEVVHNSSSNPFTCLICQKEFLNSLDLGLHVPRHQRTWKCTQEGCKKAFGSEEGLTRHVDYHQRPAMCEICGSAFRFPSQVAKHIKVAHSASGRGHTCHFCSRTYKDPDYLKEHLKTHTNPGEARRFLCSVCGKAFLTPYHRARHEESHTSLGTRAYVCSSCGKRFDTQVNLRSHEYKTHDPDPASREKKRIGRARHWQNYVKRKREKEMQMAGSSLISN